MSTEIWVLLGTTAAIFLLLFVLLATQIWMIFALKTTNRALCWIYDRIVAAQGETGSEEYQWYPNEQMRPEQKGERPGPEWETNLANDPKVAADHPVVSLTEEERAILSRLPQGYLQDEDPTAALAKIRRAVKRGGR